MLRDRLPDAVVRLRQRDHRDGLRKIGVRRRPSLPFADVDIALHVGEVLYGNVGAVDRLDFTVIGPAVNEVVRMEKLCEPLGQQILFSSRFAEAAGRCDGRLESLGHFQLRGVDEAKEIFGLRLSQTAALQRVEA